MDAQELGKGFSGLIQREKWWKELNSDEKIERMREQVRKLQVDAMRLDAHYLELKALFLSHLHMGESIVYTAQEKRQVDSVGYGELKRKPSVNPDEVYF